MDDDALANFTDITGTTPDRAQQYLKLTDGNLEQAFELFYANDGADLEGEASSAPPQQPSQVLSHPRSSTRPSADRQVYQDAGRIIHVDSDEEQDHSDDEVQFTGTGPTPQPADDIRRLSRRSQGISTPPINDHNTVDEDEAMARRLQEEYYGSAGTAGTVDSEGVRPPIARTTETLVGPGSFDPNDERDMHAAVLQQMRARRQARPRGGSFSSQS